MLDGPTEVNVGDGTPITKELVTGLDTDTIPLALTLVLAVDAGEFTVKFG